MRGGVKKKQLMHQTEEGRNDLPSLAREKVRKRGSRKTQTAQLKKKKILQSKKE